MSPFLVCEGAYLRPVQREDFTVHLRQWLTEREVTRHLVRGIFPTTLEQLENAFVETQNNPSEVQLTVVAKERNEPIGITGLYGIDWLPRLSEFRILLGSRAHWGRGIGTEVCQMLIAYGFETLNLHKIWLGVNSANMRAAKSYQKVGFVNEGQLRQEIYRNGRYYDAVRMSLLRGEYDTVVTTWPIYRAIQEQLRASD